MPQIVSEVVCSAENVARVVLMAGGRRLRVKCSSLLQNKRCNEPPCCCFQAALAALRDFWPTDFEGTSPRMY